MAKFGKAKKGDPVYSGKRGKGKVVGKAKGCVFVAHIIRSERGPVEKVFTYDLEGNCVLGDKLARLFLWQAA